jgi:TATA-box binding protein (TBP) (component of TFIID and TFIIIB)
MDMTSVTKKQEIDIKIATITLSVTISDGNCILNLLNIGRYLDIDEDIIGIKYNHANLNVLKGKYCTTIYKKAKNKDYNKINKHLFYNQITLVVNNKGNHVNVKIFANGSLHMTGCKTTEEGKQVTMILFDKLQKVKEKTDNICIVKDINGVYLDKDNIIYGYDKYNRVSIGYRKDNDTYIINNKEYEIDNKTRMFVSKKMEIQRKKRLVNFNGDEIGYYRIELLKNKNKFYKRNTNIYYDWENGLVYHNNDLIIGKIQYDVDINKINDIEKSEDVVEIEYKCNPFVIENKIIEENIKTNINCINVYFNINYKINRQRLYEKLLDMNYICKYKPESYSGIKFIYKIPIGFNYECDKLNNGHCKCTYKCTCKDVTFLIFQSGNIIVSGFKDIYDIKPIVNNFMKICNAVECYIKTKELGLV